MVNQLLGSKCTNAGTTGKGQTKRVSAVMNNEGLLDLQRIFPTQAIVNGACQEWNQWFAKDDLLSNCLDLHYGIKNAGKMYQSDAHKIANATFIMNEVLHDLIEQVNEYNVTNKIRKPYLDYKNYSISIRKINNRANYSLRYKNKEIAIYNNGDFPLIQDKIAWRPQHDTHPVEIIRHLLISIKPL